MHEIDFRAWDNNLKKWVIEGGCDLTANLYNYDYEFGYSEAYINEHIIWQEYIGLKDKNGIKIYEGDVVQRYNDYGYTSKRMNKIIERVFRKQYNGWSITKGESVEVIGHIYEKAELVK